MTSATHLSTRSAQTALWRSRWAAMGAAVAVSLGAGGMFVARADPGPSESTIVTVTPERIMDTRDPLNVGLAGPFVSAASQKLQVTGSVPTTTGSKTVVPAGATGVLLNVTAVAPTANGFISIRPGDATGAPSTSSLNIEAGSNLPNAVQVALPTSGANTGQIDITFDAYGTAGPRTDILIDVVGYLTNTGLQELAAKVATKANASDVIAQVATKANASDVIAHGPIILRHSTSQLTVTNGSSATIANWAGGNIVSGTGFVQLAIDGPARLGGVDYGLRSVEYCISGVTGGKFVSKIEIATENPAAVGAADDTDRTTNGCYVFTFTVSAAAQAYAMTIQLAGAAGSLRLTGVQSTWAPVVAPLSAGPSIPPPADETSTVGP